MQRIFEQFQEQPDARLVPVIPVAGVAVAGHERMIVTSVERYANESRIKGVLVLGPDHPEHEWRERGRPGHPFFMMSMDDDLGTEYASMPESGGGGVYRYGIQHKGEARHPGRSEHRQIVGQRSRMESRGDEGVFHGRDTVPGSLDRECRSCRRNRPDTRERPRLIPGLRHEDDE